MNTQLLTLKVIDNTPAFIIGRMISQLSAKRQAELSIVMPPPLPAVEVAINRSQPKTEDEKRIQHRDHMRQVRGTNPNHVNRTPGEHRLKQRECMKRLRAERRGQSTEGMLPRVRKWVGSRKRSKPPVEV
jgi:hypothetical protein